jgi:hypothetical protein
MEADIIARMAPDYRRRAWKVLQPSDALGIGRHLLKKS